jgi:hypothetical protein
MSRNARSIYGGVGRAKEIYGISVKEQQTCVCIPEVSPIVQLQQFQTLVTNLLHLFSTNVVGRSVKIPFSATFSAKAYISYVIGARLIWKNENPGVFFERTNTLHKLQLKLIYQTRSWDWTKDSFLT